MPHHFHVLKVITELSAKLLLFIVKCIVCV